MGSLSGFEIVLLEDSGEISARIRKLLEQEGAIIVEARTARSGIAACAEVYPHLVLCDLGMIGHGGFHFICEIKKHHALRAVPVLALSAPGDKAGILRGMQLGAADCLLKPLNAQLLMQKAARLLANTPYPGRGFGASDRPRASLTVPAEIVRAGEGGLAVEAPVALGREADVKLDSPLLAQFGLQDALLRTADAPALPCENGSYVNDLNLLGLDPRVAKAMRGIAP